jgi:hypothetical protein
MTLNPDNNDFVAENIEEMREKYPEFKIVEEEDKESELLHTAKVFLYDKKYNNFDAKFYVRLLPSASSGANIYQKGSFQYSVSTCSGVWHKKLKDLERIVEEIDERGFGAVRHKLDGDRLGSDLTEF